METETLECSSIVANCHVFCSNQTIFPQNKTDNNIWEYLKTYFTACLHCDVFFDYLNFFIQSDPKLLVIKTNSPMLVNKKL